MRAAIYRQLFSKAWLLPRKNVIPTVDIKESSIHLSLKNHVHHVNLQQVLRHVPSTCPLHFLFGNKVQSHSENRPTIKEASECSSSEREEKQPVRARLSARVYLDGIQSILQSGCASPKMHQIWRETFAKYGSSYTMFVGKLGNMVHLHRIEHAAEIVSMESKTPTRIGFFMSFFYFSCFSIMSFLDKVKIRKSTVLVVHDFGSFENLWR